jgi:hypothetical protein
MKHIKLFEAFVNEDIKIKKSISEETANQLLEFLKQAIGKKLNWKEFSKWHGGAAQLGKKSPAQVKFLDANFECVITDVKMLYNPSRKFAQLAIEYLHNAPIFEDQDVELKLYANDPTWKPDLNAGDTKTQNLSKGLARYHYEPQFDRFSDITGIGRFGI